MLRLLHAADYQTVALAVWPDRLTETGYGPFELRCRRCCATGYTLRVGDGFEFPPAEYRAWVHLVQGEAVFHDAPDQHAPSNGNQLLGEQLELVEWPSTPRR